MFSLVAAFVLSTSAHAVKPNQSLLDGAAREDKGGWDIVHLHGTPTQIGYQHGWLLGAEIADVLSVMKLSNSHDVGKDPESAYRFWKMTSHALYWKGVPQELREEIQGISQGATDRGFACDADDILTINGAIEWGYYTDELTSRFARKATSTAGGHCSAFVATGSATKDGKIVMGHNCWSDYMGGERGNVILDITPLKGNRILMDSTPGYVESGDDFGINSAGILITETTISDFHGFDESGIPEFVRMRMAMQYANSIDDVARIFRSKNNGAYANMWLIGDVKTNEIAHLELGLKNTPMAKLKDGVFYSSNYPEDPKLTAEECSRDEKIGHNECSDRGVRWQYLMTQNHGKIDAEVGKAFLSDHFDQVQGKEGASKGTLCGHGETETRDGYNKGADGSTSGKVVTSEMARKMQFWARMGHPCGTAFIAADYLKSHPEDAWQTPLLRDMPSVPWIVAK